MPNHRRRSNDLSREVITDSEESDSDGSDISSTDRQKPQTTNLPRQSNSAANLPLEELSVSASSSSGSESDEKQHERRSSPSSISSSPKSKAEMQNRIPTIPAKPFNPPEGFTMIHKAVSAASDTLKSFSELRGKQIWHITTPRNVPISALHDLSLDAVATGQQSLSHGGMEYRLREDRLGTEKSKAVLLPNENGATYRIISLPVAQTFHLEQVARLPNGITYSSNALSIQLEQSRRLPPQQPKNLRMRYVPFGSATTAAESAVADESEANKFVFKMPNGLQQDERRVQQNFKHPVNRQPHKGTERNSQLTSTGDAPRKKSKKTHSSTNDELIRLGNELERTEPPSNGMVPHGGKEGEDSSSSKRDKQERRQKHHRSDHGSSKKHRGETDAERRKRKEEKKRKRQREES